jgi:hypothetical protein
MYHNSLFVQSTLLHVWTFSCDHQTVYNQCLAKLHTFFQIAAVDKTVYNIKTYHLKLIKVLRLYLFNYNFTKFITF